MGYDSVAKAIIDRLKANGGFPQETQSPPVRCPKCISFDVSITGDRTRGFFGFPKFGFLKYRCNYCGKIFLHKC